MIETEARILLVEDDKDDFLLFSNLLSAIPGGRFQLDRVESSDEALTAIRGSHYDVCFIDLLLGESNGIDLLRSLRADQYRRPLILISGRVSREIDDEAMNSGASDFLRKDSLDIHWLDRSIRHALQRAKAFELGSKADEHYRNSFLYAAAPKVIVDVDGNWLYFNAAVCSLLGYMESELFTKSLLKITHPAKRDELAANLLTIGTKGRSCVQTTLRLMHKSGRAVFWSSTHMSSVTDEHGLPAHVICTFVDISAKKREEDKLNLQHRYDRVAIDGIKTNVAVLDQTGVIVSVNRAWRAFAQTNGGFSLTTNEGVNYIGICESATGQGALDASKFAQGIRSVIQREKDEFTLEYPCHSSDMQRWFEARAMRVANDGAVHVIVAHEDITGRKRQEIDRERAFLDAQYRAEHDALTGLLNQDTFHRHFEAAVRLREYSSSMAVMMMDLGRFKFFNDAFGHLEGDEVLKNVASILQMGCRETDILARYGGDEFVLVMPDTTLEHARTIAKRLQNTIYAHGYTPIESDVTIPIEITVGIAMLPDDSYERLDVLALADYRMLCAKADSLESSANELQVEIVKAASDFSMLDSLVLAVNSKDRYTRFHSESVMKYALMIANVLSLDESTKRTIAVASLLHDVGKIGVPDRILLKPSSLTESEYAIVQMHPTMGAAIVGSVPGFEQSLDAIRHHHEHWDGTGYPDGLKGNEIPFEARLLAVADAFSSMTSNRPYRKAMDKESALVILKEGAGTQWDESCVRALVQSH